MSIVTIHCRLVASEPIRRHLWHLMAESNTPLVNELTKLVSQQEDFKIWQSKGTISKKIVTALCEPLREVYPGQPGRFYSSAIAMVLYTYKSWLAIQNNLRYRIDGKQRWLNVVKSDRELHELSGSNLDVIKQKAQEILDRLNAVTNEVESAPNAKKRKKAKQKAKSSNDDNLMSKLFTAYDDTKDTLSKCAISYLLKNDCKVSEIEEDPDGFAHRINRIYCDRRQLPLFQRFWEDWQAYTDSEDTYPPGLLTLSTAMLIWTQGEGKGEPWNANHLALHCSYDTRLMTAKGTALVQQEKSAEALKNLEGEKPDPRNRSKLDRLKNLPARPSKQPYQGNPEILVGLSIGLANPVTVAVVNVRTGDVLTYRTPKTLLGDRYRLLNRHRRTRGFGSGSCYRLPRDGWVER